MKKFKEFFSSVTNPQTPEDWINVLFSEPELVSIRHDYAEVRKPDLYHKMLTYMQNSPDFEQEGRGYVHKPTGRRVVIKLQKDRHPYVTNIYWTKSL